MRHLILALMIALLPLRGWIGDVMATEMASGRTAHLQIAIEKIAANDHRTGAEGHFDHASGAAGPVAAAPDCAGHGNGDSPVPASGAHCEVCPACQACHTVALSPTAIATAPVPAPLPPPHSPVARFASADMAHGQKPPIS